MSAGARILVVDDDQFMLEFNRRALASLGYDCATALTGEDALCILERDPGIRMLFSDMGLGAGMNGAQLARRALVMRPGLGVLLTSGLPGDLPIPGEELPKEIELLPKPYRRQDLAERLARLL